MPTDTTGNRAKRDRWNDSVGIGLTGLLVLCLIAIGFFGWESHKRGLLRDRIHEDYCVSRGMQRYTSWGLKCVDKDGVERVIPDSVWDPIR